MGFQPGPINASILEIMREAKEKGIAVHSVKGAWKLNGSMESKIVLTMLAMIAEIERDLISERTNEGFKSEEGGWRCSWQTKRTG